MKTRILPTKRSTLKPRKILSLNTSLHKMPVKDQNSNTWNNCQTVSTVMGSQSDFCFNSKNTKRKQRKLRKYLLATSVPIGMKFHSFSSEHPAWYSKSKGFPKAFTTLSSEKGVEQRSQMLLYLLPFVGALLRLFHRVTFCCGHKATVAPLLLNTASSLQRLGFRKAFRRRPWIGVDLVTKNQNRKFHLKELRLKSLTRWP
jgi:hypothetical protein